ncbi:MAG: hydroxyisourate hydrolase [Halobacteriovorax sp.]|nr:hydroxyisourate hydrolase [Halobacteriovorax sp.]|tara:strand:- start:154901 stop:155242 length:342 start_codon:yes stop_codon:yes gene_type:complete
MSPITTHILDTASGRPASNVPVILEIEKDGDFEQIGQGLTDEDGRVKDLLVDNHDLLAGIYRISFNTEKYYQDINKETFYPEANIVFKVIATDEHYHVPLLLSGFGYSTYRGS